MNRSLLLFIVGFLPCIASAQHQYELFNQGDTVCIQAGALVTVQGDVHHVGTSKQAWFNHSGFLEVQGNLFSNMLFQQRGTGTIRLHNRQINGGERQFIQGSYAVRGGQNRIGVDDGSIYSLELSNSSGLVYLVGTGAVADVRSSINFHPHDTVIDGNLITASGAVNSIVTHNVGLTGTPVFPSNGSKFSAVFGMMNSTPGNSTFINNTISKHGTESQVDQGYVIGKLRRSIAPDADSYYGFPLGLEPSFSPSAARGVQYLQLNSKPNSYDVVTAYFEQGSSNNIWGNIIYCGGTVSNYYGSAHGEWMLASSGFGPEDFNVTMYPQDFVAVPAVSYFITRNNGFAGNAQDCFSSPVGLRRSGFYSFGEFGFAGTLTLVPVRSLQFSANRKGCDVVLNWSIDKEEKITSFEVQKESGSTYISIQTVYRTDDKTKYSATVSQSQSARFRLRMTDIYGQVHFSPVRLLSDCYQNADFRIYPNPSSGLITLDLPSLAGCSIHVFSITGVRLMQIPVAVGRRQASINLSTLPSGTYWLRAVDHSGKNLIAEQVIIKRKGSP